MKNKIAPSMMCADILSLKETLAVFESAGIEYLHIDVMDGSFVPNLALGSDYIRQLHGATSVPLDIHLMITEPEKKLGYFDIHSGDIVSFHIEATDKPEEIISAIKAKGARAFVAVSPDTPLQKITDLLPSLDGVLIMTVYPGFAGQKMIPACLDKIAEAKAFMDKNGLSLDIEVDGNVSCENAVKMKKAGASIFVTGTASVFGKAQKMEHNITDMRKALGE